MLPLRHLTAAERVQDALESPQEPQVGQEDSPTFPQALPRLSKDQEASGVLGRG